MFVLPKDKENDNDENNQILLDSSLVATLTDKETPSEVICQRQGITGIGDLKEVLSLRRLNLSFNPISSLKGIDQLKELRRLDSYCCRLTDIDHLSGSKRVEYLMLQQNFLTEISSTFLSFNKLKELRIDRNNIMKLDNLTGCTSLRLLDISYNQLTTLEGIAGLQSLSELRASNNQIETLKHMRALPNLKEINVSNNKLTNLIGLEMLPSIESVTAENNSISTIQIPQTYMSHLNKKLDKNGGGSISRSDSTGSQSGKDNSSSTKSHTTSKVSNNKTSRTTTTATNKKTKTSSSQEKNQNSEKKNKDEKKTDTVVGLQYLNELHLRNNQIESLAGMESYGIALESIDLSNNSIKDSQDYVLSKIGYLEHLEDLKLAGNMIKCVVDETEVIDDESVSDNSTLFTMKESLTKASSTSRLLRRSSTTGSVKPALDDNNPMRKSKLDSRRSSMREKYGNMPLEEALALACPSLRSLDDEVIVRENDNDDINKDDREFHTWDDPSQSLVTHATTKVSVDDTVPVDEDDDFKMEDEEEDEAAYHNSNNPVLTVETVVSREELTMRETAFRNLLQETKDTITKAVKDNLPPEVGQEVTDLVLNVRPVTKTEKIEKPTDSTIGAKVRKMMDEDLKKKELQKLSSQQEKEKETSDEPKREVSGTNETKNKKPAQLAKNLSSLSESGVTKDDLSIDVTSSVVASEELILKSSNKPPTPKPNINIDRSIGATKVNAFVNADKPPPPVAHFDLRSIKRHDNDIQSARTAEDRRYNSMEIDERRRVNSARMDSESRRGLNMRSRMTNNSTSTVRLISSNITQSTSHIETQPPSELPDDSKLDETIHMLDMSTMDVGLRRAGSAPLSTIKSEVEDDKSIQWNLLPPSELPQQVVPPPTTIDTEKNFLLTEEGSDVECVLRNSHDMIRPSSSHSGVTLTKFRVPVKDEKKEE